MSRSGTDTSSNSLLFGQTEMSDSEVELKWKGHKYDVNFDEFPKGLEQATLGDLKEKCKKITGVPLNAIKLLASGGKYSAFRRYKCGFSLIELIILVGYNLDMKRL
jgi:hypothetical protein